MLHLDFEPVGRRCECITGESVLECARRMNVDIVSICGGMGTCKRCRVQVMAGKVSELTSKEESAFAEHELQQNYHLACQAHPLSDAKIYVPPDSLTAPQRTQVEGLALDIEPEPHIANLEAQLKPPSTGIPRSDDQCLWTALSARYGIQTGIIDLAIHQNLSPALRALDWHVRLALRGKEIVALGTESTRWLGLAVDIGTTKIAAYLVDLESGKTLASKGLMNPQIPYGEDVVSRIFAANKSKDNSEKLHSVLVDTLNQTVSELCDQIQVKQSDIADAVVVGNTVIHHLFMQLPVRQLGLSPYVPAVRSAVDIKARDLGLNIAPGSYVHMLPNIAGFVGADHVAMLLATGISEAKNVTLAIDIGTNTEICLNNQGRLASVSCASGPAFEGAHIQYGMRAAPGAIEHVRLSGERLDIQTIGGQTPIGICGSGLLDVIAQLRLNNVLDSRGRMGRHPLVRKRDGFAEFVLVERPDQATITVTQKDVRELQLAKAAIRLGAQALLEAEGLTEECIEQVIIAGAFGTFIDVESAVAIGMLPTLPLDRFTQVGNASGTGARLALISRSQRKLAQEIASRTRYLRLGCIKDFHIKFAAASFLP